MKDPVIFIKHILENIQDVENFSKGIKKEQFIKNKEKQNAIIRSIEIIGEAVKNIPEKIKIDYPIIPWKEIAGTRDKIIHQYFGIDLELIWKVIKENLPELKKQMILIKTNLEK